MALVAKQRSEEVELSLADEASDAEDLAGVEPEVLPRERGSRNPSTASTIGALGSSGGGVGIIRSTSRPHIARITSSSSASPARKVLTKRPAR
jgi:hypothetical protein